ncbi:hypothetical protein QQZ08_006704 [Neonectria magnoliae]|uniref:Rpr2-domain-containing protein n=1 Tax=Neonectria magnoliae TaxID=2732573 RepID=A0ABR1HZS7_9HYPO
MAKVKGQKTKGPQGVQNRHIYNRASYLYQAATYFASQPHDAVAKSSSASVAAPNTNGQNATQNLSRQMISSMRAVSLKAQIRQSPALKRTICKFCDTLLIEGQTCNSTVENDSKGGRKPWADLLTIRCKTCGNAKRYPVNAPRQKRRSLRNQEKDESKMDVTSDSPADGQALETLSTKRDS